MTKVVELDMYGFVDYVFETDITGNSKFSKVPITLKLFFLTTIFKLSADLYNDTICQFRVSGAYVILNQINCVATC